MTEARRSSLLNPKPSSIGDAGTLCSKDGGARTLPMMGGFSKLDAKLDAKLGGGAGGRANEWVEDEEYDGKPICMGARNGENGR